MHLENGAKEITEIQGKKDVRQEFSAEALAKFDQILEDDKIEKTDNAEADLEKVLSQYFKDIK